MHACAYLFFLSQENAAVVLLHAGTSFAVKVCCQLTVAMAVFLWPSQIHLRGPEEYLYLPLWRRPATLTRQECNGPAPKHPTGTQHTTKHVSGWEDSA